MHLLSSNLSPSWWAPNSKCCANASSASSFSSGPAKFCIVITIIVSIYKFNSHLLDWCAFSCIHICVAYWSIDGDGWINRELCGARSFLLPSSDMPSLHDAHPRLISDSGCFLPSAKPCMLPWFGMHRKWHVFHHKRVTLPASSTFNDCL